MAASNTVATHTKTSKVWEHFSLVTANKKITCKVCKADLAYHGSTSVMQEHLKRKHVGQLNETESDSPRPKKRATMDPFLQKRQMCTPQRATALTESVLQMLIYDMRPLSVVDGAGFQQMIAQFNPDYILPSRTHFTHLMQQKYSTTFLKVKEILKEVNSSLTLTSDVWTSRATEAYLGVSCHFITKDWQMKTLNLATLPLEERHTAANIMIWMEEVIEKFDILPSKIKAIVHDNGSNMVAAAQLLEEKHGWSSVRCAGHTLQLIVNSALKEPSINKATGTARSLVEHFRRSELANSKLKKKQQQMNTAEHKLIQDVITRWNSTYYMVERLLEQRWRVTATLSDPEVTPRGKHYFDLKPEQWVLLEELVQGLGPFECATVFLSGQEYATASCLPQLVKGPYSKPSLR
ncbi:E3 SUMO-protein ligase ZBED1 isoform X1 [Paralichthys olivaceus]|uniref:E3 SUMO-protein ligase ZBED1 isoform X1 n=1 Tax=Paralichthys olivaceus TaxID=8255 RepID=UPI0037502103